MKHFLHNQLTRIVITTLIAIAISLALTNQARADQQIVTDPVLNAALNLLQDNFNEIIGNSELTSGSIPDLELMGSKGNVSFVFDQTEGSYQLTLDSLKFTPTTPISADSFNVNLLVKNITLSGSAKITVNANGQNYTLDCPDNQFVMGPLTFTAQAQISDVDGISLDNAQLDFDPTQLTISLPCLDNASRASNSGPSPAVLRKLRKAMHNAAARQNSSVVKAATSTIMLAGTSLTSGGIMPFAH